MPLRSASFEQAPGIHGVLALEHLPQIDSFRRRVGMKHEWTVAYLDMGASSAPVERRIQSA
jgi:hypothetical protein